MKIVGSNGLASPDLVKVGGAAVEGVYLMADWAPGGMDADGTTFDAAFHTRFGRPPENWNAMGYSVMRVIATALKNAGPNPTREHVRQTLTKVKNVKVVVGNGMYSLDENRIPRYGVSVLTVSGGKFVVAH